MSVIPFIDKARAGRRAALASLEARERRIRDVTGPRTLLVAA